MTDTPTAHSTPAHSTPGRELRQRPPRRPPRRSGPRPPSASATAVSAPDVEARSAQLSKDGLYRYRLHRVWAPERGSVGWVMCNPSCADANLDDATVRRCRGFARAWGYGGISVVNLFALRATDPRVLRTHPDPVGPGNDDAVLAATAGEVTGTGGGDGTALTVCAWGVPGALHGRDQQVLTLLRRHGVVLHHLGLTTAGHPRHPVRLPAGVHPTLWPSGGTS